MLQNPTIESVFPKSGKKSFLMLNGNVILTNVKFGQKDFGNSSAIKKVEI